MSITDPVFDWLAFELAAIFALISIILLVRQFRKNKQLQQNSAQTVKLIKQKREGRRQQLADILQNQYGLVGQSLESEIDVLQQRERELHKNLITLFVTQNGKTLNALPDQLESLLNAGLAIKPAAQENPEQRQQIQQLAAENAELTATINRLQTELSAMVDLPSVVIAMLVSPIWMSIFSLMMLKIC